MNKWMYLASALLVCIALALGSGGLKADNSTPPTSSATPSHTEATYDEVQPGANDPRVKEGFAAYKQGDFKKAYDIWLPLAEAGNAEAQFRIGRLYDFGEGNRENIIQALLWYENAKAKGHLFAAHNLGLIYRRGDRVRLNFSRAVENYLIAAEGGEIDAQFNLGIAYAIGDGNQSYFVDAYMWFFIASENGDAEAKEAIADLNKLASKKELKEGQKKARETEALSSCGYAAAPLVVSRPSASSALPTPRAAAPTGVRAPTARAASTAVSSADLRLASASRWRKKITQTLA